MKVFDLFKRFKSRSKLGSGGSKFKKIKKKLKKFQPKPMGCKIYYDLLSLITK